MKSTNLSWISFYKLIMSQNSYKDTYKELTDRLRAATSDSRREATYLTGVHITINCRCNLEVCGLDYWEELVNESFNIYEDPKTAIVGKYLSDKKEWDSFCLTDAVKEIFKHTLKVLYTRFTEECKFKNVDNLKEIKVKVGSGKYATIALDIDNGNLIAWDWDYIYIWHKEQECGQGWISAPQHPEDIVEQTTVHLW